MKLNCVKLSCLKVSCYESEFVLLKSSSLKLSFKSKVLVLTLFRMDIFGAALGWGLGVGGWAKKHPLPKICHAYPKMMNLRSVILKEDPKNI